MNAPLIVVAALASALLLASAASASSVAPCPDDYRDQAESYAVGRLERAEGARVQVVSEPNRVRADVKGRSLDGWAVDLMVKARQASGASGVYVPYTVIFVDGVAVALCEDASKITRV
jgi:hypothetical protein